MSVAAIDTTVLYAAANAQDARHADALPILRGIDAGDLPDGIVLDFVLAETMNGLTSTVSPEAAVDFLNRLEENSRFSVERMSGDAFTNGKVLFRRHDRLSLVDALVVSYVRDRGVEYLYAFDDDFDGIDGVTRLKTPDNPFGV